MRIPLPFAALLLLIPLAGCETCGGAIPVIGGGDGGTLPLDPMRRDGGLPGQCQPLTCADRGANCGPVGNGCGDAVECGTCTGIEVCGGAGVPSQCGFDPPPCTPRTCESVGAGCGFVADGCGDVVFCGDCSATGQQCGGGGIPNQCGGPAQSADACPALQGCNDQGASCGLAGNGCGGLIDCGSCAAPQTCGGAGVPSQCGIWDPPPSQSCGDGVRDVGEACDDGNRQSGDGCTRDCRGVEPGYACPQPGAACVSTVQCGDGILSGSETCDDGNTQGGDGCSISCQREAGYRCPIVGAACRAAACGDGIVAGFEECDDRNGRADDGCSASCLLEAGFRCDVAGQPCVPVVCGNGVREGAEDCDDGNFNTGDGCSPLCTFEPLCSGGVCQARCGDGIRLASEGCDDGNRRDGDGCSANCTVESGFTCTEFSEEPMLPIVYRDFIGTIRSGDDEGRPEDQGPIHRDFQKYPLPENDLPPEQRTYRCNLQVADTLDAQGKPTVVDRGNCVEPIYNTNDNNPTNDIDPFSQWFRSDNSVNRTVVEQLDLSVISGQSGTYQYFNNFFFPLTGRGFQANDCLSGGGPCEQPRNDRASSDGSRAAQPQNFHFTSETRYWFTYRGGEKLTFDGDDDVWVFINGKLAVDINGMHPAISRWIQLPDPDNVDPQAPLEGARGSVDGNDPVKNAADALRYVAEPRSLGLVTGRIYEVAVFHAERHTDQSQYRLTLQNFLSARSVCEWTCGDGIATRFEVCDDGSAQNTGAYGACRGDCLATGPRCGDGIVQAPQEECDDGVNTTVYLTSNTPAGACAPSCQHPVALSGCNPQTCESAGATCGYLADGCGGVLECGACAEGSFCGGGGIPNQCAAPACAELSCASLGAECGQVGDGCSGVLDCGSCAPDQVCGADGQPNRCVDLCIPLSCADVGAQCGLIGDGCGRALDCGTCESPLECGYGGQPNRCGFPSAG